MSALPAWAQAIKPIDMDGAAEVLGVSRRFLVDVLRDHKHYERRGAKKVFYPEHIALLREALQCPDSSSMSATEFGTPLEPSPESAYEKALELATKRGPKNSRPGSRRGPGTVITLARKPSVPSRKQP